MFTLLDSDSCTETQWIGFDVPNFAIEKMELTHFHCDFVPVSVPV